MAYDYGLWIERAKRNDITPFWAALSTLILAPWGYWLTGDGYKGLKYTVIVFFLGYLTLGVGALLAAVVLPIDVYRTSKDHEKRFKMEGGGVEKKNHAWFYKLAMAAFLVIFAITTFYLYSFI